MPEKAMGRAVSAILHGFLFAQASEKNAGVILHFSASASL
jgi:hypothetical protein